MESVFCIAASERVAGRVLEGLKDVEIPGEVVSVVAPGGAGRGGGRLSGWWARARGNDAGPEVIADTLAWLSTVRELDVEGIGSVLAVGPVLSVMEDVGLGAGLLAALAGLGLPDFEARRYISEIAAGRILVGVHGAGRESAQRAEEVFERCAGEEIATAVTSRAA